MIRDACNGVRTNVNNHFITPTLNYVRNNFVQGEVWPVIPATGAANWGDVRAVLAGYAAQHSANPAGVIPYANKLSKGHMKGYAMSGGAPNSLGISSFAMPNMMINFAEFDSIRWGGVVEQALKTSINRQANVFEYVIIGTKDQVGAARPYPRRGGGGGPDDYSMPGTVFAFLVDPTGPSRYWHCTQAGTLAGSACAERLAGVGAALAEVMTTETAPLI
jgi:hypothetical protein